MCSPLVIVCRAVAIALLVAACGPSGAAAATELSSGAGSAGVDAITVDPHADLPTRFGDEDDVIQRKQTASAAAAAQRAAAAAAAAAGVLKVPSNHGLGPAGFKRKHDRTIGAHRGPIESEENYDDDDEDEEGGADGGDDDGFLIEDKVLDTEEEDSEYKSGDYAEEGELGPTLDNFGSQLPGDETTDELPMFMSEPQSTYVIRSRPAVLRCTAAHTLKVCWGFSWKKIYDARSYRVSRSSSLTNIRRVRLMF